MRLRRRSGLCIGLVALVAVAIAYAASPFVAAWQIRAAIKSGDTAALETAVAWDAVRASLRSSIALHTGLDVGPHAPPARRSLWQRFKAHMGNRMLDRFIANYISPTGLVKLDRLRNGRQPVPLPVGAEASLHMASARGSGTGAPPDARSADWWHKARAVVARIKRAQFTSLTSAEIEIADRSMPDRHYVARLDLTGTSWVLTELRVIKAPSEPNGSRPSGPRRAGAL